jgi:hypothetical protein
MTLPFDVTMVEIFFHYLENFNLKNLHVRLGVVWNGVNRVVLKGIFLGLTIVNQRSVEKDDLRMVHGVLMLVHDFHSLVHNF